MSAYDPTAQNGSVEQLEQLDQRDVRALTQYLTVLDDIDRAAGADGLFLVVSQSGNSYLVDAREGACECPDHTYRDVQCKHLRRVAFATGERAIPAWVDRDGVDPDLGEHVAGEVRFAAADGGQVVQEDPDDPTTDASDEDIDRHGLSGIVCGSIAGDRLPDWAVYNAVAAASRATIERILEEAADR